MATAGNAKRTGTTKQPRNPNWTTQHIPNLSRKTIIITGANSGIGFEATRALSAAGAHVVMACRDLDKAGDAAALIREGQPSAALEILELDLADLGSVRSFAQVFAGKYEALHVLCNNAGVMAIPRRETVDGFEMQLGTNHLGHFALTAALTPRLLATRGARVVTVTSTMHWPGKIRFDDLQSERRYNKWIAYAQSKLANLLFCFELERRFKAAGAGAISVACHPGYANTNLQSTGPRMHKSSFGESFWRFANALFTQTATMGALPTLYAATSHGVTGGDYVGPDGFAGQRGQPALAKSCTRSRDAAAAARLWEISEKLTGATFSFST
jgi:NAD(P)-dependent dehydrogenase (short-subunit alcohol dehydrogenase family)